jgi:hypothetical protein
MATLLYIFAATTHPTSAPLSSAGQRLRATCAGLRRALTSNWMRRWPRQASNEVRHPRLVQALRLLVGTRVNDAIRYWSTGAGFSQGKSPGLTKVETSPLSRLGLRVLSRDLEM